MICTSLRCGNCLIMCLSVYDCRPGGPQFYINTMDNADFHGPGGQPKVEFPEEADVCYAKVSSGVELLQQMMDIPVAGIRMIQPVTITDTRIVSL